MRTIILLFGHNEFHLENKMLMKKKKNYSNVKGTNSILSSLFYYKKQSKILIK